MHECEFLQAVRKMPPLRHKVGEVFDIEKSEVAKWVVEQPGFRSWMVNKVKNSGCIVYDPETGCWSGVPFTVRDPKDRKKKIGSLTPNKGGRPRSFDYAVLLNAIAEGKDPYEAVAVGRGTVWCALKTLKKEGKIEQTPQGWRVLVASKPAIEVVEVEA